MNIAAAKSTSNRISSPAMKTKGNMSL
jgi:hypothetical protein